MNPLRLAALSSLIAALAFSARAARAFAPADPAAPTAAGDALRAAKARASEMAPLPGTPAQPNRSGETRKPARDWSGVKLGVLHYEILTPDGSSRRVDQDLYGSRSVWGGADTGSILKPFGDDWYEPGQAIQSAEYELSHDEGYLVRPGLRTGAVAVVRDGSGIYYDVVIVDAQGRALAIEKSHRSLFHRPKVVVKQASGERLAPELQAIVTDDFTVSFDPPAPAR